MKGDFSAQRDEPMASEDAWVESEDVQQKNVMPVERRKDPAVVIEINARMFRVEEHYLDTVVGLLLNDDPDIKLTRQDRDLLCEARQICEGNKPQVRESTMRVAAMLICDVIERLNKFEDNLAEDKKGVLVFLPGLHEIFEFIEFINETYDSQWVRKTFDLVPLHSALCE